jgi:hypothetical protein
MLIEIDQVLLKGLHLSPGRLDRIRLETAAQLERLIERHGLPPGAGPAIDLDLLRLPHHAIRPGATDREIARQLAQAIYRRLHPGPAEGAEPG